MVEKYQQCSIVKKHWNFALLFEAVLGSLSRGAESQAFLEGASQKIYRKPELETVNLYRGNRSWSR